MGKTVLNLGRGINLSLSGSNKSLEKQEGKLKLTVPRDEKFSSTTTKPYYNSQGEDNISSSLHQVFKKLEKYSRYICVESNNYQSRKYSIRKIYKGTCSVSSAATETVE